ncbi:hypothetical protein [Burkholderia thailandensis]|uniref:hypothetical protein n=1 Tax=Burkholderia thailandensis TaxID=57975 RepID=UPI000AD71213|nr:hypothetical protein [Burkholderia thailandensis]
MTLGRRAGGGAARRPKPCVRACAPLDAIAHAAAAAAASIRHAARGEAIKRFVAVSCSCCKKPRRPQPRCRSRRHGRHRCTCRLDDRFDCRVGGPVAPSRYRLRNPIDEFADCDRPHLLEYSSMTPSGNDDINQSPRVTLFHKSTQQDFI